MPTPPLRELIAQIEDRSAALRTAAASASEDARVPGCPAWSLRELVAHLGEVQRSWAAAVKAGPAAGPPEEGAIPDRVPTGDLLRWSEASTEALLTALRDAPGPEQGCWTWWGEPRTVGAVARHQVQEAAVHARDAQEAGERPQPLPRAIAEDGVEEFLATAVAALPLFGSSWPHPPARVALRPDDAGTCLVALGSDHAVTVDAGTGTTADAQLSGSASDLVLVLYGRAPLSAVHVTGDRSVAERFLAWLATAAQ
jgi:uncharacterized protein (TIGR03083 family)